jgi:hypothetical protein
MTKRRYEFDGDLLRKLAGVEFSLSDLGALADLAAIYVERLDKVPDFMLPDCRPDPSNKHQHVARRAFVQAVAETWWEASRRTGRGSYRTGVGSKSGHKGEHSHSGPLIRLLQELLRAVGQQHSAATLHHDLEFLRTEKPRQH